MSFSIKKKSILLVFFIFSFSCIIFLIQDLYATGWETVPQKISRFFGDPRDAGECFNLIKSGKSEAVISDSKSILKNDRWNADAYACITMAYYFSNKKYLAMKRLKEAEETIPKEDVDKIHNKIWTYLPELLAEKEYRDNYTLSGGACILRNVTSIDGTGYLIIGRYFNPYNSSTTRHLRAYKCNPEMQGCKEIDHVCPDCKLKEEEAKVIIKDYKIVEIKKFKNVELSRNIRYISKILELEREHLK